MNITEIQGYAYFFFTVFLTVGLYAYIYHLYKNKKDESGVDYEDYSNMALKDDIVDTPVKSVSEKEDK
ncbi:cytochrome c oxidase, cbb3-type, CcoQ subunit [Sulfurimonas sp. C5]|uniref:cytochrome c oxidase, cbb3-type, CcoQ subunit n=1 Tax=Sulfurimonas sp. C5 TaxID=3036947 RepID=UPI00245620D2|nr:cytochrome c oxidase, cbb3-type, CcoQ subunit [Sulfurimonas sp. C5]MDH4944388.1 cytochrome c oxidase, cbb3-type, CcoQ subunit [Sulfurimonas sp. C5]